MTLIHKPCLVSDFVNPVGEYPTSSVSLESIHSRIRMKRFLPVLSAYRILWASWVTETPWYLAKSIPGSAQGPPTQTPTPRWFTLLHHTCGSHYHEVSLLVLRTVSFPPTLLFVLRNWNPCSWIQDRLTYKRYWNMAEKEKSKCSSLSMLCSVSFWPREHLKCASLQSPYPDGATWSIPPFCSVNWYICFDNYSTSSCGLFKLPVHSMYIMLTAALVVFLFM